MRRGAAIRRPGPTVRPVPPSVPGSPVGRRRAGTRSGARFGDGVVAASTTTSTRPVSTWSPSATVTSVTVPAEVAWTACSIFMASSTTSSWPAVHGVAHRHRDPDHPTGHRGQGRSRRHLVGRLREPVLLDQGRAAVGPVHEGRRAELLHPVPPGHPVDGQDHRPGRRLQPLDLDRVTVDGDGGQVPSEAVEPVAHRDQLVAVVVAHLLERRGVVAEPGGDGGLHRGPGPPCRPGPTGRRPAHAGAPPPAWSGGWPAA